MQDTSALGYMGQLDYEANWRPTSGYPELAWDSQYGSLGAAVDDLLSGDGSDSTPYLVETSGDLQAMAGKLGAHYELVGDIDASGMSTWNGGDGFRTIGDFDNRFNGTLDGNGYTIDGLAFPGNSARGGLFGYTDFDAEIRDVKLVNAEGSATTECGVIASVLLGTVERVTVDGTVSSDNEAGLIAGDNRGTILDSKTSGSVSTDTGEAGGIVGLNDGISGYGTISNVATTATVSANSGQTGGIAGYQEDGAEISTSYAAGPVDQDGNASDAGGLVGKQESGNSISDCYWDTEATGQTVAIGTDNGSSSNLVGLTTAEMQGVSAESNMNALDFGTVWRVLLDPDDYPALDWEASFLDITIASARSRLAEGDTYTVDVDVANNNDGSVDRTVSLLLNGTAEDSTAVSLASGQSTRITLQTATDGKSADTYDVDIAGKTGDGTTLEIVSEWLQSSWTDATDGRSQFATPAVGSDCVYAGGLGSDLRAYDRSQQQQVWAFARAGELADSSPLFDGSRNQIYVGGGGGVLYALDTSGNELWRHTIDSAITSSPVLDNGTVYVGANDGTVLALDVTNSGSVEWSTTVDAAVYSQPAVDTDTVYVTAADGSVHALARSDGSTDWTSQTGGDAVASGPTVDSTTVYAATDAVYALDASDGSQAWQTSYAGTAGSTPVVDSGTLYVGDSGGTVHALDAANSASQVWSYDAGVAVPSTPAVVSSTLLVADANGTVHAIDREDGSQIATRSVTAPSRSSPVVTDDTVYVGTDSDTEGLAALANVPGWKE